jgi:UDP-N-acetylglucosamine 4,6-dehydratase/5-epimerase
VTGRRVFVTGGSGTFGSAYIRHALASGASRVVSFARGEHRQAALAADLNDPRLECWIGDVRDRDRLRWALRWCPDVVLHCAALKRVETCEQEPDEAHKTNVEGTRNVVAAAMLADVPRVVMISSDKSCLAETYYGKTKADAEGLALGYMTRRGSGRTRVAVARYGNVLGSQGSVLDVIAVTARSKTFRITDPEATRYWWSVEQAVAFVDSVLDRMQGGEIWVPKLHAARVVDLVRAMVPDVTFETVGMRGVEKRHETMIAPNERTWALDDCYVVAETCPVGGIAMPPGWTYTSNDDPQPVRFEVTA